MNEQTVSAVLTRKEQRLHKGIKRRLQHYANSHGIELRLYRGKTVVMRKTRKYMLARAAYKFSQQIRQFATDNNLHIAS